MAGTDMNARYARVVSTTAGGGTRKTKCKIKPKGIVERSIMVPTAIAAFVPGFILTPFRPPDTAEE